MGRLVTTVLFVVFLVPSVALAGDPTMLYAIEDKKRDGRVFLLGSIHVGQEASYPLDPTIEEAFALSEGLAGEVDITSLSPEQSMDMMGAMMFGEDESLSAMLEPVV
ncbi:MAG: TraB/GumN family protein, partial [Phycisphaeraceae bacterium]|nr:TraB/GumN family protein [Phycisphaeraceae bacterium]